MEKELISESFSEDVNIKESVLLGLRAQSKIPKNLWPICLSVLKRLKKLLRR